MAEGGRAEKFPDEWDLQLLGATIISKLSSGVPLDFLVQRYIFLISSYFTGSILTLEFEFTILLLIFDFRIFLSYQSRLALLETELGSSSEPVNTCGCPSSDGSNLGASDPHCPFVRRRELIQLFL